MNRKYGTIFLALVVVMAIGGCGGGGGGVPPYEVDPIAALEHLDLKMELKTDKAEYSSGEPIHSYWVLTNTGRRTHMVELSRPNGNDNGDFSSGGYNVRRMSDVSICWTNHIAGRVVVQILAGKSVRIGEAIWDQKLSDGSLASGGQYAVDGWITDVTVDGKCPSEDIYGDVTANPLVMQSCQIDIR